VRQTAEVIERPDSIEAACAAVKAHRCVLPSGGGTKPALSRTPEGVTQLDMRGLSGLVEYEPDEFTFTALAGTSLAQVQSALATHGQYLPFDPPLAGEGATLGGTVAAGLSGPGRLRFGGVRDFIVGVRWVDGTGEVIRGGGKVVKNAAGFDFPKLFTGSMGRLGVLVELSFKVFPTAAARVTCAIDCKDVADAVDRLCFLCGQSWEVEALELSISGPVPQLLVRFMGDEPALTARGEAVLAATGRGGRILTETEAAQQWSGWASLRFGEPGAPLARVPVTPSKILSLEKALAGTGAVRHYGLAGNAAWIAGLDAAELDALFLREGLSGVMIRGEGPARIGARPSPVMEARVKSALDAGGKFPPL
jgi:glycolate oxidase FAD binding subunit